jgi:hypothetical protein
MKNCTINTVNSIIHIKQEPTLIVNSTTGIKKHDINRPYLYNSRSLDKESITRLRRINNRFEYDDSNFSPLSRVKDEQFSQGKPKLEKKLRISPLKYLSPVKSGPFEKVKTTNFGLVYLSGGIPIKLIHGNVKLKIEWSAYPEDLIYNPLIVICFEGLLEVTHPYNFLAKQASIELLQAPNARNKMKAVIQQCVNLLRKALSYPMELIYSSAILITKLFIQVVKEDMLSYAHLLIQPLNKFTSNK